MGFALKTATDVGVMESNWLTPVPRFVFLVGQTFTKLITTTIVNVGILALGHLRFRRIERWTKRLGTLGMH